MENNQQPNFAGEEMKLPSQQPGDEASAGAFGKNTGVIIAGLFVALGLILAGIFYWYSMDTAPLATPITPERPTAEMNKEPESPTATAQVESYGAMSTSDELDAIEADLEGTNLDALDSELMQIDAELEASVE
jgi:hypothetical protein